MKVTMVMVMSVNGHITHGVSSDLTSWTSKEDLHHFKSMIASHNLIIMGRKTYAAVAKAIRHEKKKLRVVLTSNPLNYHRERKPGMLEFFSLSPAELLKKLKQRGYTEALLVGGAATNAAFFNEHLVHEVYLTIEPQLFQEGLPFISGLKEDIEMDLISVKKLNEKGTLLLHYKVV